MPNNSILLNFYANFIYNQIFFIWHTPFVEFPNGFHRLNQWQFVATNLCANFTNFVLKWCFHWSFWVLHFRLALIFCLHSLVIVAGVESFMNILILIHPNERSSLLNKINRFPMVRQFFWFNVVYNNGQNIKLVVQAKQFVI